MIYKNTKRALLLLAGVGALFLSGCATRDPALYYWGDFQNQQYAYFNGEKGPEDSIQQLEKIREEAKSQGKLLPPGFEAHLGMLYGLTGRTDRFEQGLVAERQYFPESTLYVDFLLKTKPKGKPAR